MNLNRLLHKDECNSQPTTKQILNIVQAFLKKHAVCFCFVALQKEDMPLLLRAGLCETCIYFKSF